MGSKKKLALLMAAAILVSLFSAGCGQQGGMKETTRETVEKPEDDGIMDVLMIGNSYNWYFLDELIGVSTAAGVKMKIGSVYYSGCSIQKHWEFLQNKECNYAFVTYDENGNNRQENMDLDQCLVAGQWDVITLQPGNGPFRKGLQAARDSVEPYMGDLLAYIKDEHPYATYYWHHYWAPEIGNRAEDPIAGITTAEKRDAFYDNITTVAMETCEKYDLPRIPTGAAWQIVRDEPILRENGLTLCTRNNNGNPLFDDYSHDGDVGGGQYLNACVWFEVLTGKSCVGNTFRPERYTLSEEKIALLQQAAHKAVAEVYGEDYAK